MVLLRLMPHKALVAAATLMALVIMHSYYTWTSVRRGNYFKNRLETVQREINAFKAEHAETDERLVASLRREIDSLVSELSELRSKAHASEAALRKELDAARASLSDAQTQHEKARAELLSRAGELSEREESTRGELARVQGQVGALSAELAASRAREAEVAARVEEAQRRTSALEKALEAANVHYAQDSASEAQRQAESRHKLKRLLGLERELRTAAAEVDTLLTGSREEAYCEMEAVLAPCSDASCKLVLFDDVDREQNALSGRTELQHFTYTQTCEATFARLSNGTLFVDCPPVDDRVRAFYTIDPAREVLDDALMANHTLLENRWLPYTKPVRLPRNAEHVLVRCDERRNALIEPRLRLSALERARRVLDTVARTGRPVDVAEDAAEDDTDSGHEQPRAATAKSPPDPKAPRRRPLNFLFILLDSVSRIGLTTFLPRTVEALQDMDMTGNHSLYFFSRYVSIGEYSPHNQGPLLSGELCSDHGPSFIVCKPREWLWDRARALGYVTMLASTWCRGFLGSPLGIEEHSLDHFPELFWCKSRVPVYRDELRLGKSICMHQQQPLKHVLDYQERFHAMYRDVGTFSFVVTHEAHSPWIRSAGQFDLFLPQFIRSFTARFPDTVLVLSSDHGSGYQEGMPRFELGRKERALPFMALGVPKRVAAEFPALVASLAANRRRLVTAYDFHLTLAHLLYLHTADAEPARNGYSPRFGVDLLTTQVSPNRTCAEAGMLEGTCPCSSWRGVAIAGTRAAQAAQAVLDSVNSKHEHQKTGACLDFALARVTSAMENEEEGFLALSFEAQPDDTKFEATVRVARGSGGSGSSGTHDVVSVRRTTAWGKYAACTDPEVPARHCVCKL